MNRGTRDTLKSGMLEVLVKFQIYIGGAFGALVDWGIQTPVKRFCFVIKSTEAVKLQCVIDESLCNVVTTII